jgi:uncharacterized protein YjbI with pentapeptide repeats
MTRPIDTEMIERIKFHIEWAKSEGKKGCELDLSNADLAELDFLTEDMPLAKFDGARLYHANLYRCEIFSSSFIKADLFHADLTKAKLDGSNFTDANLVGIRGVRASFDEADMHGANLAGADLLGAYLPRTNFEYAVLSYANLGAVTLRNTCFHKTDLRGVRNLNTAQIYSIKIGSAETPVTLEGEEARAWLIRAARGEVNYG